MLRRAFRRDSGQRLVRGAAVAIALVTGCHAAPEPTITRGDGPPGSARSLSSRPASAYPPSAVEVRRLTTAQVDGFFVLGATSPHEAPVLADEALVAEEPGAFRRLLAELQWRGPTDVDFRRYLVFAFSAGETGCYSPAEPAYLELLDGGLLRAQLAAPYLQCLARGSSSRTVRLVAIARTALPEWGFRYARSDGTLMEFRLRHPLGRLPCEPPKDEVLMRPISGRVRGRVPWPDAGEARLARLDDGDFVWVVHHAGGGGSVLDCRSTFDVHPGLPGVAHLVRWDVLTRRFAVVYDEYGVARWHANLPRYEAELDPEARLVRVGERGPAWERKLMAPIGTESAGSPDLDRDIDAFARVPFDGALREHDDGIVLLDASLRVAQDRPAYLCAARTPFEPGCALATRTPAVEHLRAPSEYSHPAPVIARLRGGEIVDIVLTR